MIDRTPRMQVIAGSNPPTPKVPSLDRFFGDGLPSPLHRIYNVVADEAPESRTQFASVGTPPPDGSDAERARAFAALLGGRRIPKTAASSPSTPPSRRDRRRRIAELRWHSLGAEPSQSKPAIATPPHGASPAMSWPSPPAPGIALLGARSTGVSMTGARESR